MPKKEIYNKYQKSTNMTFNQFLARAKKGKGKINKIALKNWAFDRAKT